MKFKFILLTLVLFSIRAYSQSKNDISVLYGESTTNVNIHDEVGDYGYLQKTGNLYGITYTRAITKWLSVETGFITEKDKVELSVIEAGLGNIYSYGNVNLISVPVYAKFTFLKYFFADGGFLIDKQTNYVNSNVINNQSGLGEEVGIGAKYTFMKVTIFVNPYIRQYDVTKTDNNLYEQGVKFGLGYSF